jgi:hypothetical protein
LTTADQGEWLERREAARRLAVPEGRVKALADAGEIRTRGILGVRARYSAADVARLARECVKGPASGRVFSVDPIPHVEPAPNAHLTPCGIVRVIGPAGSHAVERGGVKLVAVPVGTGFHDLTAEDVADRAARKASGFTEESPPRFL